ncbi:hypothetical protein [Arthrobacter alpinus]|uniref:hypothetical protein n=1 Tax=Arthrobacter alpinus TaxID=656366 RepID=UPI00101AEC78|nr:hypothetical protein [Arthrobacter alpinus]
MQLQALGEHPGKIVLGLVLGLDALAVRASIRLLGQELSLGLLAALPLGVPVHAATIGLQQGLLEPGEAAALVLGALVTTAVSTAAAGRYGIHGHPPVVRP